MYQENGFLKLHFLYRLEEIGGLSKVNQHASCLTGWLSVHLQNLRHWNGSQVCHLYWPGPFLKSGCVPSPHSKEDVFGAVTSQGPVITFNLLLSNGHWVGYNEVFRLARVHNIHLRVGRFCNPGKNRRLHLSISCTFFSVFNFQRRTMKQ